MNFMTVNPFVWAFLIMTPIASWAAVYFRKWKYKNHFVLFEVVVLLACICFALPQDSKPHYLLGMTLLQEVVLFEVAISYVMEVVDFILTLREKNDFSDLRTIIMHTLPGYIGIFYMYYVQQCGGIIIRLLLDSVSVLITKTQDLAPQEYHEVIDDIYVIAFIITRVIYYSFLSVYGVYVMILHWDFIDKVLFVMYCVWTVYVLYDHVYHCFWNHYRFETVKIINKYKKMLLSFAIANEASDNNEVVYNRNEIKEFGIVHNEINDRFIRKHELKYKEE